MNRNDLLLHPIRARIVTALAGRALTTAQLSQVLPEVPTPSLYRHVRLLAEANLIVPTEARRIRGATERAYTLAEGAGQIDPGDVRTAEQRLGMLTNFTGLVGQAYRIYLEAGGEEMARANMAALYLTPEEDAALSQALRDLLTPYLAHRPEAGRRRRLVSVINQPDYEPDLTELA